jgi:hypothetical protein
MAKLILLAGVSDEKPFPEGTTSKASGGYFNTPWEAFVLGEIRL